MQISPFRTLKSSKCKNTQQTKMADVTAAHNARNHGISGCGSITLIVVPYSPKTYEMHFPNVPVVIINLQYDYL